jgi:hypothetical protein
VHFRQRELSSVVSIVSQKPSIKVTVIRRFVLSPCIASPRLPPLCNLKEAFGHTPKWHATIYTDYTGQTVILYFGHRPGSNGHDRVVLNSARWPISTTVSFRPSARHGLDGIALLYKTAQFSLLLGTEALITCFYLCEHCCVNAMPRHQSQFLPFTRANYILADCVAVTDGLKFSTNLSKWRCNERQHDKGYWLAVPVADNYGTILLCVSSMESLETAWIGHFHIGVGEINRVWLI